MGVQISGSKNGGPKMGVQISGSKNRGPKMGVQKSGSKNGGPKIGVQKSIIFMFSIIRPSKLQLPLSLSQTNACEKGCQNRISGVSE